MSNNQTPWVIAVLVTLITSPIAVEIYKHHTNTHKEPNPPENLTSR